MSHSRRKFIKVGGLSLAASGLAVPYLQSCTSEKESSPAKEEFQNMLGGIEPLTEADYLGRQEKALRLMKENNIDALLITGGTNMEYFFNMSWWLSERVFGGILNTKGEPVWICPAFEEERAAERIRFGKEIVTWEEHESPYERIGKLLKQMGLSSGTLATGPNVRSFVIEGLRKYSGLSLTDGSVITEGCRSIKTEKELKYMDVGNTITKKAYQYGFRHLQAGMTPAQLRQHISEAHAAMGVSGSGGPMFGFISAFPHGSTQRHDLEEGDVVLVDGGCSVEGYRSDVSRTVVFGTPSDKQRKVHELVLKAQKEAHKAIRPGVTAGSIDAVARKVIEDGGYGPGYKYFAHRLGHGIGMQGHEYPYLVKDNPLILKPGMTFSNEPGIYIYDEFGVRIEDCFVVTEDGARMLGGMLTNSLDDQFGGDWG